LEVDSTKPKKHTMLNKSTVQLMALGLVGSFAATAAAQDSGALIDALVRKGVLKDQEAEQIRSQLSRDYAANTPAGKLNISSSVKELKLSGDVRLRYQYDNQAAVAPYTAAAGSNGVQPAAGNEDHRTRYRLRLRVNADYKLADDFFAGFGLQTEQKSDSGNQTMSGGNGTSATGTSAAGDYFQNYSIFINKAFIGWSGIPGVTIIGGKQPNPLYTTDLVWDADINPTGISERFDLHKFLDLGPLELSLVGGQFVVADNDEGKNLSGKGNRDAIIYHTQLIAAAKLADDVKLTVAPGFYTANGGAANGDGGGEYNSVKWAGLSGASLAADQLAGLKVFTAPGDVSFKIAGKPAKTLWDLAWNADAHSRTALYNVAARKVNPSDCDSLAYLVGFQIGENKKKGDWSLLANYRQVGLSAIDPNINDSDWSLSYTNMAGYKVGFFYNLGDATTIGTSFYSANNLRTALGVDTAGKSFSAAGPGSQANAVQVLQVDLSVKF
jgi:polyhydroxyalkanoate synthesis regulator phasin